MSDTENDLHEELPQIWQFIHPLYNKPDDEAEEEENEEGTITEGMHEESSHAAAKSLKSVRHATQRPADYVKLSRRAPRLGRLIRYLAEIEDEEELQHLVATKDPVTGQSLLQWAALQHHFMLVEYLVKRLKRGAFAFDTESPEMTIFARWEEMKNELPNPAEVLERQRSKERARAERRAQREAQHNNNNDDNDIEDEEEDEDEDDEPEAMPEELVYESLSEFHDEWGSRGLGLVKRVGELGFYTGARRRDGTKHGLGASLYANGDCYCGTYCNNQREGTGVYWWSQQGTTHYTGQWAQNMRHGYGRMVYADGSRYLGQWRANRKHGQGRYTYADGSSYDGTWCDDAKHGHGVYTFTDGSVHTGSFVHNAFVAGTWAMASGTVRYVGNFDPLHERPIGAGVFIHQLMRLDEADGSARGARLLVQGRMQREGCWRGTYPDEKWVSAAVKGTTSPTLTPYFEMILPHAPTRRVPLQFDPSCVGYDTTDLVHVANFAPLQEWLCEIDTEAAHNADTTQQQTTTNDIGGNKVEGEVAPTHKESTLDTVQEKANSSTAVAGVRVSKMEIVRLSYDPADATQLRELSIRPLLVDHAGHKVRLSDLRARIHTGQFSGATKEAAAVGEGVVGNNNAEEEEEEDIITLTAPTARLFVLLLPFSQPHAVSSSSSSSEAAVPMVLLEETLRFNSSEPNRMQCRLPSITLSTTTPGTSIEKKDKKKLQGLSGEEVYGAISELVGPALRLELHTTRHMLSLLHDAQGDSVAIDPAHGSNARTSVWLYAQQLHPDAFASLTEKLRSISEELRGTKEEQEEEESDVSYATRYLAVPLSDVINRSSDAVTVLAACEVLRRRASKELPVCTIEPQRPPTPLPPAPQPRPALQPLYDARAARHAIEQQEQQEEEE